MGVDRLRDRREKQGFEQPMSKTDQPTKQQSGKPWEIPSRIKGTTRETRTRAGTPQKEPQSVKNDRMIRKAQNKNRATWPQRRVCVSRPNSKSPLFRS